MEDLSINVTEIEDSLKPLQQKAKLGSVIMLVGIVLFLLAWCVGFFGTSMNSLLSGLLAIAAFPVAIVFLFGGAIYHFIARSKYVKEFKTVLGVPVLNSMFHDVKFYPERGFTQGEFQVARLIRWRNDFDYCSEDLIEGVHRGVAFRQADLRITHTTGSGKDQRTVVDVDGRIWEFDCKKQVASNVLIVKNSIHASLESGLNRVELEDVDFNKRFSVYADDEHSAFYVLTPHFMNYIKSLYGHDNSVYISFDGRKLYFMQSGKGGIFEPSDKEMNVPKEIQKAREELQVIDKIIDALKIDE